MFKPMVVDIYHADQVYDLKATAAAGIRAVIHKSSQGVNVQDSSYDERRKLVRSLGLLWGAYHFATDEDVGAQVENFLTTSQPDDNTLLVLDFEPNRNNTMALDQARAFMQLILDKTGRRPAIYSGNLIKEELGKAIDPFFAQHRLWISQYGPTAKLPPTWKKYWLWQYTGDGIGPLPHTVPGIRGKLDLNIYDGTPEQLAAEWATGEVVVAAPSLSPAPAQIPEGPPTSSPAGTPPSGSADGPIMESLPGGEAPVIVTTEMPGRRYSGGPDASSASQSPGSDVIFTLLKIVAVLGLLACVVGGVVVGYAAGRTGDYGVGPLLGGAMGLAAGCVAALVLFGTVLLLLDIDANARRTRELLERRSR